MNVSTSLCLSEEGSCLRHRKPNANDKVHLDCNTLGLSRNSLDATAAFLMERDCFVRCQGAQGSYEVAGLSLQGKLRLEQLVHG